MMHFISEIPEPAAYFANDFTRCAATKENAACGTFARQDAVQHILGYPMNMLRTANKTYIAHRAGIALLH